LCHKLHLHSANTVYKILNEINTPIIHCKKDYQFSRPQPGCHIPNSPWPGIIKFFRARESLVSDIPAGEGKIADLFTVYERVTSFLSEFLKEKIQNDEKPKIGTKGNWFTNKDLFIGIITTLSMNVFALLYVSLFSTS
jgi:hypothetical protein